MWMVTRMLFAHNTKEKANTGEGEASRCHILSPPFLHMEPFVAPFPHYLLKCSKRELVSYVAGDARLHSAGQGLRPTE